MAINDKNIPITIIFRCRERGAFRGGSVMVWSKVSTPIFSWVKEPHREQRPSNSKEVSFA